MAPTSHRPHGQAFLTTLSMMVLVGTEIFGVAIAGGWAIAGLFELGDYVAYGLMAVFGVFGVWLMVQLWQRAMSVDGSR